MNEPQYRIDVCLAETAKLLLHGCDEIPPEDRLRLANTIVAEFIEGKRGVIPELA